MSFAISSQSANKGRDKMEADATKSSFVQIAGNVINVNRLTFAKKQPVNVDEILQCRIIRAYHATPKRERRNTC